MNGRKRIALMMFLATIPGLSARSQVAPRDDAPEAVDEARERNVMERFLAVLEKTPWCPRVMWSR